MRAVKPISLALLLISLSCSEPDIEPSRQCNFTYPNNTSSSHPKNVTYQSILDKYVKQGLPGITTLIRDDDGLWIGYAGKADIGKNIPFTPCHPSKVASITKFMVGTLTLMIQERGLLNINDPLTK